MNKRLEKILEEGVIPIDRVVVHSDGSAVAPKRAENEYSISPDIVFIRDDGWTLGAPNHLKDVAYKIWKEEWAYFAIKEEKKIRPIEEYNT